MPTIRYKVMVTLTKDVLCTVEGFDEWEHALDYAFKLEKEDNNKPVVIKRVTTELVYRTDRGVIKPE